MTELTERTVAYGLGLLGGLLFVVGAIVAIVTGTVDLVVGRAMSAIGSGSQAVLLFVLGGLALFFAWVGQHGWKSRSFTSGLLLVLVAVIGWVVVGLGSNIIALVGAILVFLAGVLQLIDPAARAIHTAATA